MIKRGLLVGMLMGCCLTILSPGKTEAVLGIPDEVPAATLVVPLLEAGISSGHNTLFVATNTCDAAVILHWEVWNVEGRAANLFDNVTIDSQAAWVTDFKTILDDAESEQKDQLTDGSFYHGFLTVDMVREETNLPPTDSSYPFGRNNCLKGVIYYVRLAEGAANGISALHIEGGLDEDLDDNVRGFYRNDDNREEIDNHARYYAERTTREQSIANDPDGVLDAIISRVFLSPVLNGSSRIVLWTWGYPRYGAQSPGDVGGPFPARHVDENGDTVGSDSLNLSRVVNIINVSGTANGEVWIEDLPEDFNVYAFSFNAAEGSAALTWEVMFPSTIVAE